MVLVCNFHSIYYVQQCWNIRFYQSGLRAYFNTSVMYSLHFQSEGTYLLYLYDYELNQRLNLDWQSCYAVTHWYSFIHQLQITKWQKFTSVFLSRTRVMPFNIIKCSLGLVVCLDAAVLFSNMRLEQIYWTWMHVKIVSSYFCGDWWLCIITTILEHVWRRVHIIGVW